MENSRGRRSVLGVPKRASFSHSTLIKIEGKTLLLELSERKELFLAHPIFYRLTCFSNGILESRSQIFFFLPREIAMKIVQRKI